MLNVVMLNVVMLSVVMLDVVMLSVVASDSQLWLYYDLCDFGLMAMVEEPLPLIKILLSQPIVECLFSVVATKVCSRKSSI